jgi:hypothetical protein
VKSWRIVSCKKRISTASLRARSLIWVLRPLRPNPRMFQPTILIGTPSQQLVLGERASFSGERASILPLSEDFFQYLLHIYVTPVVLYYCYNHGLQQPFLCTLNSSMTYPAASLKNNSSITYLVSKWRKTIIFGTVASTNYYFYAG